MASERSLHKVCVALEVVENLPEFRTETRLCNNMSYI